MSPGKATAVTSTFERVRAIMTTAFPVSRHEVTSQASLESLGIDSLGVAEMLWSIEDKFKLSLPPEPANLETVADVVEYVNGLLASQALKPAHIAPRSGA